MAPIFGIILLIALLVFFYKLSKTENLDIDEEREELKANLITMMDELEELDEMITESADKHRDAADGETRLTLLRKKVVSKKLAIEKTLGKIEIESQRNWEYRRLQAERTVEAVKEITRNNEDHWSKQMG